MARKEYEQIAYAIAEDIQKDWTNKKIRAAYEAQKKAQGAPCTKKDENRLIESRHPHPNTKKERMDYEKGIN